ncbi:hypothetical protein [Geitlerinema sp. PCC 9228]|uniref:hypothetical protein n=1 Tax=Geitlerinema sp. PCC 9228 TaxID=111611 RepID=UPI0008F9A2EC|nr:hypothetical protein [Geitlerinema sp. PCC 9228]
MLGEHLDEQRLARYSPDTSTYNVAIVTDEDLDSQVELEDGQIAWQSLLRYDRMYRTLDPSTGKVSYSFEEVPETQGGRNHLLSLIAEAGRGAEFSELVRFGDKLIALDDRTGLICEIRHEHELIPRNILITGSGDEKFKGFKAEWATLKGDQLVVGSHGRVTTDDKGNVQTGELEWVKFVDPDYRIHSANWHDCYEAMRRAVGVDSSQGYLTHEAAEWHPGKQLWYFFPRKVSFEPFDEEADERDRGSNTLIVADETFQDIQVRRIGDCIPERGVSSIKFIPGHPEECVALKSLECGDRTETYIFCFHLNGDLLSEEIFLGNYKCEGIEIV